MLEKIRDLVPGKKTYTVFGLLFAVAVAGFFGLDLSPIAGWLIPGEALPVDVLEAVNTVLANVLAVISAVGVILRFVTKSEGEAKG